MSTLGSTIGTIREEVFGGKRAYSDKDIADAIMTINMLRRRDDINLDAWDKMHLEIAENILAAGVERGACREEMGDLLECIHAKRQAQS